jgi:hypothetical protein
MMNSFNVFDSSYSHSAHPNPSRNRFAIPFENAFGNPTRETPSNNPSTNAFEIVH